MSFLAGRVVLNLSSSQSLLNRTHIWTSPCNTSTGKNTKKPKEGNQWGSECHEQSLSWGAWEQRSFKDCHLMLLTLPKPRRLSDYSLEDWEGGNWKIKIKQYEAATTWLDPDRQLEGCPVFLQQNLSGEISGLPDYSSFPHAKHHWF